VASKGADVQLEKLIMAEVSRQLEPTHTLLQQLKEWQLAFWSNGSGRPPGFIQNRIISEDQRYREIADEVKTLTDHKSTVDSFIVELRLAREFREKREKEAKDRRNFWIVKVALPVTLGILSLLGLAIKQTAPVIQILWEDYLKAHPEVTERIKNISQDNPEPFYAVDKKQSAILHNH